MTAWGDATPGARGLPGSGHAYAELKKLYDTAQLLPWFEIPATLRVTMKFDSADVSANNLFNLNARS